MRRLIVGCCVAPAVLGLRLGTAFARPLRPRRRLDRSSRRFAPAPQLATRLLCDDAAIERPLLDRTKLYRIVELANGLRVMLVSDPTTETGGAAVNTHAGSFQDPPGFEGLAHFHEHMLFLGTAKYPGEDAYEGFLSANGGHSNAYTADEDTNFYFECATSALAGALDRFAQFFIAPSLLPDMVEREVSAIDSEHRGNIPDDGWRLNQVDGRTSAQARTVAPTRKCHAASTRPL
jgi:secreted Zn-dependent insulinase-like peptidase